MRHVAMPDAIRGRQRYERVLDGAFVMLHWTYQHPEFPDALAMLDDHRCHYFDVRGVARLFELELRPDGWTMIRRDPDFWQRSTSWFTGAHSMRTNGENSHDAGVSWQHDLSLSATRLT